MVYFNQEMHKFIYRESNTLSEVQTWGKYTNIYTKYFEVSIVTSN